MTPTQRGLIAEAEFLRWVFGRGLTDVCKPIEHDLPYDFLVYYPLSAAWLKVQVKSAYSCKRGRSQEVNFRRGRANKRTAYKAGDFDCMFIFDAKDGSRYWIPWDSLAKVKSCFVVSGKRFEGFKV